MENEALLDLATDLGYELAMSGAETFRVEETVSRVLSAYGMEAEVFAIPNVLIVTMHVPGGNSITRMRRIGSHGNDLDAVEKFSGLSRRLCTQKPEPKQAQELLRQVREERKFYSPAMGYLGAFLGAMGFGLFFGCGFYDSLCAGVCGMLATFVGKFLNERKANSFFQTIASSFMMALLAYGLGAAGIACNADAVTIGALMLLVPGLLFTNAMRDIIYGDTNSGVNRIVQVLLIAVAIALGTATAWRLSSKFWGQPQSIAALNYGLIAQCTFAFIGCYGFSLIFNIHGPGGLLCALGGALSWAVYLLVLKAGQGEFIAYFWSGLFSSVYSEIMARIRKYPAISYLVVSIFPMIPGAGVYFTMNYAMQKDMAGFASKGMNTAAIAGILAVGILLGSTVFRMYSEWKMKQHLEAHK